MNAVMALPFNERLRELREAAGLTQEALARAAGLSTSAVSKLEQRDIDPSWSTVQVLARALGVNCAAFEGPSPEPAPGPPPPQDRPKARKPRRPRGG
jgi:transcriptional regulator with XRE-family HTH domain